MALTAGTYQEITVALRPALPVALARFGWPLATIACSLSTIAWTLSLSAPAALAIGTAATPRPEAPIGLDGSSISLDSAMSQPPTGRRDCSRTSIGQAPLTDGPGLYHTGENTPPHLATILASVAQMQPRASDGSVDGSGAIVFLALGMSNTSQEFSALVPMAMSDPRKRAEINVLDGAIGGYTLEKMGPGYFQKVNQRLATAGFSPSQVQAIWLKAATASANGLPDNWHPWVVERLTRLAADIQGYYPNTRIIYVASRTYGGYATLTYAEPLAYEHGYAYRMLIERWVNGDRRLAGVAPIVWGPYLWADGTTPRSDGFTWQCSDTLDGGHPSTTGRQKIADLLLNFLHVDETTCWYRETRC